MRATMARARGLPSAIFTLLTRSSRLCWVNSFFEVLIFVSEGWGEGIGCQGSGDGRGVLCQWGDRDLHVREQRQLRQQGVQLIVGRHVKDAVVCILAHHAPEMTPAPIALQFLRVGLLSGLDGFGLRRGQVGGQVHVHADQVQHVLSPQGWGRWPRSTSTPKPGPSGSCSSKSMMGMRSVTMSSTSN